LDGRPGARAGRSAELIGARTQVCKGAVRLMEMEQDAQAGPLEELKRVSAAPTPRRP
jgi:hypothetical protein